MRAKEEKKKENKIETSYDINFFLFLDMIMTMLFH